MSAIIDSRRKSSLTDVLYKFVRIIARPSAKLLHLAGATANQVTVARLIGSFLSFYLLASFGRSFWLYCLTALFWAYTDAVDGVMAREHEKKSDTDTGVLLDPVSDKVMMASMYGYHYDNFPHVVVMTIVSEFILAALSLGSVVVSDLMGQDYRDVIRKMKATKWGKYKLNFEVITAILMTWYAASPTRPLEIVTSLTASFAIFLLTMSLLNKVKKIFG